MPRKPPRELPRILSVRFLDGFSDRIDTVMEQPRRHQPAPIVAQTRGLLGVVTAIAWRLTGERTAVDRFFGSTPNTGELLWFPKRDLWVIAATETFGLGEEPRWFELSQAEALEWLAANRYRSPYEGTLGKGASKTDDEKEDWIYSSQAEYARANGLEVEYPKLMESHLASGKLSEHKRIGPRRHKYKASDPKDHERIKAHIAKERDEKARRKEADGRNR
jgi:hypothetical protein